MLRRPHKPFIHAGQPTVSVMSKYLLLKEKGKEKRNPLILVSRVWHGMR